MWKLGDDPVDDRPTFLAHALAMSLRHGPGPWPEEAHTLPDDPPPPSDGGPLISSVVRDGIESHHFRATPDAGAVTEIADLLDRLATTRRPAREDLSRLHDRSAGTSAIAVADDLVEQTRLRRLPGDRIRALGRHLAEHGTRRDTVKIGLVLVGAYGDQRDRDLLLLLGTLEELTLYAVVALVRTQPDRQRAVYELARRVEGWGRIHAVERLKGCDDPEIKAWLLRDGFRNGIMNEYLAYIAATTGGLWRALVESDVDDALLDGAGDILAALALGGPAEDMSDYDDALPAMGRFAELLAGRQATLRRLHGLLGVLGYLRDPGDGARWPSDDIARLRRSYQDRLAEPRWSDLVLGHLADPRDPGFHDALWAAGPLELPVVPQAVARLEIDPLDGFVWWSALGAATSSEAERLCVLAERLLPLSDLANGPGDVYDLGEEYAADRALESVVSRLDAFPGIGLPLIRVALRNRITRLRRAATGALAAWPASAVPDEAGAWVRRAAAIEPDEQTRAEMLAFLVSR